VDADDPRERLARLIGGYRATQAVHVAATLGIADELAAGAKTSYELADAVGAHAETLYRLLRALAGLGVLRELPEQRFELTDVGDGLRTDAPRSLHGRAAFYGRPAAWAAWSELLHSVRTGDNAFRHVHGVDIWTYRAEHPEEEALFDGAMTSMTRQVEEALVDDVDFGRYRVVVDVGGGRGTLAAALLAAYPRLRAVVFDQAQVVAHAHALLQERGIGDRAEIVGGSFFDSVPPDADAYVLKSIIHDWDDTDAVRILRACATAAPSGGAVLVVERDLGAPNEAPESKLLDLTMLVGPGGRERSCAEYEALFATAGLEFAGETPIAGGWSVYEARRP
jgi:hypothetical protein